jgi:dipeptidyl-peptidase-3
MWRRRTCATVMWVSSWAYEKGMKDSVIVKVERNGETYYDIRDYDRNSACCSANCCASVQRIKSQGDYEAAKALGGDLRCEGGSRHCTRKY